MRQSSFAEGGFERYSKRTRRERFLQEMDRVVPWEALEALIEPCYPSKRQGAGRPAVGLDRMLRIHGKLTGCVSLHPTPRGVPFEWVKNIVVLGGPSSSFVCLRGFLFFSVVSGQTRSQRNVNPFSP